MKKVPRKILLTFDVEGPPQREDFLDSESLQALYRVLVLLKDQGLRGIFFITGSAAKSLGTHPNILELLQVHEIGYHSTVHSANPKIFEYTDIESYEGAVEISHQRETSEINPITGKTEGKGGIFALKRIFPEKEIRAFRAPFLCWTPPHLEALREMGFRFDFSSNMSRTPELFKGLNFMPYPVVVDSFLGNLHVLVKKIMSESYLVFLAHPSHMLFKSGKSAYLEHNCLSWSSRFENRSKFAVEFGFFQLKRFLNLLKLLHKRKLIEIQSELAESKETSDTKKVDVKSVYDTSMFAARSLFNYEPKFVLSHFYHFIKE